MRLYGGKDKIFPEFIIISGERFAINADFRNILRIFAMMKDGNIPDIKKILKMREWFLPENNDIDITGIIKVFGEFVNSEQSENQGQNGANPDNLELREERQFCYEFDGEEIYASFLSEYNIDLINCGFLHWYKFKIMLDNLSETSAFKKKIALRFLNLNGFSRENPSFLQIMRTREAVQLPYEYNADEIQEIDEFKKFWDRV